MLKTWIAKYMKCFVVGIVGTLVISGPALSWERVPKSGGVYVRHIAPRNAPITVPEGGQGFYFVIDQPVEIPIPGCTSPMVTFFVPKTDPADAMNTRDNPAYRDSVDALRLVYAGFPARPIAIYVDVCINGYPRVVGLDFF